MHARNRRRAQRGMTLIEIMVVIVILGLIASAVAVNVVGQMSKARVDTAKNDVRKIADGVDTFKVLKGRYPTTEEGLGILIKENILKANKDGTLKDPWDKEYVYLYPGQTHQDGYDVKSYGADGQPGGEGENADVVNP
ncbi:general secretion pathway protein G [Anaeromyxobacter sp. K]|uniref:Type II secretion system core protein G n=1 Tax=Anaeromyxobacter dehalogenans (strain ATCC BAA-258 / DSM 21875 / 2CP-1) TaxID=455488 RepID=B8JD45_ANAD2|nr:MULTISPECIES: type II secretion system major pseudopilin GspG [Anaeromyxobacter]ACG71956.1 general secretion pathway protein G [Anaeromyxobacter sp. K]ACL64073.1 general secretion pathway protein G [Anaeromyxobacter dehalogenans 2CP-1]